MVSRARIVLLAADGLPNAEIARRTGTSRPTVVDWRARYDAGGITALHDQPRSGRPSKIDEIVPIVRPEADRARAQAEEATKTIREGAAADAEAKRQEAEAEAAKIIASAKREETRAVKAAEERLTTLQQQIELTEKRLNQLAAGLRNVAVQLETLGKVESLPLRRDEDQTNIGEETLDESLRASIEA